MSPARLPRGPHDSAREMDVGGGPTCSPPLPQHCASGVRPGTRRGEARRPQMAPSLGEDVSFPASVAMETRDDVTRTSRSVGGGLAPRGPQRRSYLSRGRPPAGEDDVKQTCNLMIEGRGPLLTMVKLGCSFSGKPGKDPGDQDGATTDSVPLISPLDVSQLQPPFPDQVVIKTQTEYQLSSPDQPKKFPDLEAQKLACNHPEEGRRLPTARMIAFAMALLGCVLIMYKAIWYDQFTCPDGFLLRHKICTPLTLEMYYTEMDPERHRSILAAIGAYPLSRKHGTETPSAWGESYRAVKEGPKAPTQAGAAAGAGAAGAAGAAATEPPGKPSAPGEKEAPRKAAGSAPPPAPQ